MSWSWLLTLWCWDTLPNHGCCLEDLGWSLTMEVGVWGATLVWRPKLGLCGGCSLLRGCSWVKSQE